MHLLLLLPPGEVGLDHIFDAGASSFWWTLLIFGVSLPFLWKLVFGPLMRAMEERELAVRKAAEDAERARLETEEMRAAMQQELEAARLEASKRLEEVKRIAAQREQELLAQAKAEAEKERQRARAEIETALQSARQELRTEAARLALDVAERVLGREFTPEDQRRLLAEFARDAQLN